MPKERPRSPIITKVIPEKHPPGFNGHPKGAQHTQRDASAAQRDAGVDKGVPKGPQRSPQRRHEVSNGSPKETPMGTQSRPEGHAGIRETSKILRRNGRRMTTNLKHHVTPRGT